ncbi:MAG: hypothetical protein JWN23_1527 [Rhodocyclales bacterium]|nr:hypothetical protein [Rhodocyclales bacterium]
MTHTTHYNKFALVILSVAAIITSQPVCAVLTLADVPLYTSVGAVAPNLLVTVDASGSMAFAYVPDSLGVYGSTALTSLKRFKSSDYNALYYNPSITYLPPPKYNGSGCTNVTATNPATCYPNVDFTAAPAFGLKPPGFTTNLSNGYHATADYPDPGSPSNFSSQVDAAGDPAAAAGKAYYYRFWNDGRSPSLGPTKPASCTSTVASQKTDDNCYVLVIVGSTGSPAPADSAAGTTAQQQQNFANWYSYYRTRILAATSGFMTAFSTVSSNVRLAWQDIHPTPCGTLDNAAASANCQGRSGTAYDNRMRTLGETVTGIRTHKQDFYEWLADIAVGGGTPTIAAMDRAGKYFQLSGSLTATHPLAETPPTVAGTLRTCRVNYNLLITDGGWCGDSAADTSVGDADSTTFTIPVGTTPALPTPPDPTAPFTTWTPAAPYRDGQGYNLADIAFYYWKTPMKTGIRYNVPRRTNDPTGDDTAQWLNPRNDPATWLHLNTYTIGLGMASTMSGTRVSNGGASDQSKLTDGTTITWTGGGSLPIWGGSTFASDYSKLALGTSCAASPTVSTQPSPYCWPPTLKQESCAAGSLADISQQYKVYDMWHSAIASRGLFFGADSPKEITNALTTVLSQVEESHGSAAALAANSTGLLSTTMIFQAKLDTTGWFGKFLGIPINLDGSIANPAWDAATKVPAAASRNIFTFGGTSTPAGQTFTSCTTSLSAAEKTALDTDSSGTNDGLCTDRLAWLRGDHTKEVRNSGTFRNRVTNKFVDESDANNNGNYTEYLVTPPSAISYEWTLGDIVNSDPVYVLNSDYGYATASGLTSAETTSYAAFVTSNALRTPMIYVGANDGMLHAFQASATAAAGGGKELFAYVPAGVYGNLSKLTDPSYTHKYYVDGSPSAGDAYISGGWKTILVGGLNAGGKSIYALDITSPTTFAATKVLWEFSDAADLGFTYSQPQIARLASGDWVAIFGNGYNSTNDKAYLYVVRLSDGLQLAKIAAGTATANGLSTPVLHTNGTGIVDYVYAGDLQGHLWKFDLTAATSSSWVLGNGGLALFTTQTGQAITVQPQLGVHPLGGTMIYFGTGQYLTAADIGTTILQSFYAIWDKPSTSGMVLLSSLVQQTITAASTASVRQVSSNPVDYATARGWYINLAVTPATTSPERVVSAALVKNTRIIFTTLIPSVTDPCVPGGQSWLMELNPQTGGQPAPVFDLNGDGIIDASDAGAGILLTVGAAKTPTYFTGPATATGTPKDTKIVSGTTGGLQSITQSCDSGCTPPIPPAAVGRVFWRQIQ